MNNSDTTSSDPDVSQNSENMPDQRTRANIETKANNRAETVDPTDTSAMVRALKYELEQKDMEVKVDDDGGIIIAEKFDQTYRIHPDGTVDGTGFLKDGIEDITNDLETDHETGVEAQVPTVESDSDPGTDNNGAYSENGTE